MKELKEITINTQSSEKVNSWERMMMLFQLYWPCLRQGFIGCLLFPFLAYFIVLICKNYMGVELDWLLKVPIVVLIYLAPLMLTKYDYQDISAQLPVTRINKFCFLLLIFWIAVPLTIEISLWLSEFLGKILFNAQIPVDYLNLKNVSKVLGYTVPNIIISFLLTASFIWVALYYVVTTSRNKEGSLNLNFKAIISLLLVFLLSYAIIVSLIIFSREEGPSSAKTYKLILTVALFLTYEVIGLLYLIKLYKHLRNRGF